MSRGICGGRSVTVVGFQNALLLSLQIFHVIPNIQYYPSFWAVKIVQMVGNVSRGPSLTPPQETKKKLKRSVRQIIVKSPKTGERNWA
jgi:hypothetical protein